MGGPHPCMSPRGETSAPPQTTSTPPAALPKPKKADSPGEDGAASTAPGGKAAQGRGTPAPADPRARKVSFTPHPQKDGGPKTYKRKRSGLPAKEPVRDEDEAEDDETWGGDADSDGSGEAEE